MIQLNGVSPFATNPVADPSIAATANQSASGSFQSQLSAALTATLEKFGIDPNQVALSIAPIVTGAQPQAPAATRASVTPPPPYTPGDGTLASQDPILNFDDAYWAKQPAAVQALRNMDDQSQRSILAAQLAASGYKIDAPIMVWGWDPSKVTSLRQGMGYSWVPSAFQNPVAEAPGVDDHGSQPYDPTNPPSGSIGV
jgi:hypothetical protein